MSYQFYLVLHLFGIFMILVPLGGMTLHIINGGTRDFPARKWAAISHGIGLLIAFVAGFGLMARLGLMSGFPFWIIVKLVVWLALGILPALIYRQRQLGKVWWGVILALALVAVIMAVYKPTPGAATVNPAADPALLPTTPSSDLEAAPSGSPNP